MVFLLLYAQDLCGCEGEEHILLIKEELQVSKREVKRAQERALLIREKSKEIDSQIASLSKSYDFHRIRAIERNVLRLSMFEIAFDPLIPPKVAIDEGLRLAKKFSTKEAASFINAILDQFYKKNLGEKPDEKSIDEISSQLLESEQFEKEAHHLKEQSENEKETIEE